MYRRAAERWTEERVDDAVVTRHRVTRNLSFTKLFMQMSALVQYLQPGREQLREIVYFPLEILIFITGALHVEV